MKTLTLPAQPKFSPKPVKRVLRRVVNAITESPKPKTPGSRLRKKAALSV